LPRVTKFFARESSPWHAQEFIPWARVRAQTHTLLACLLAHSTVYTCTHEGMHTRMHTHTNTKTQRRKTARTQANLFLLNKSLALSLPDYVDGHLRVGEELLYADLSLFRRHAIGEKAVHVLLTCPRDRLAYLTIIYPYRS